MIGVNPMNREDGMFDARTKLSVLVCISFCGEYKKERK
jgi:hypothetical protein